MESNNLNIHAPRTHAAPTGWKRGLAALSPLMLFLCLYLVTSLAAGDFYKMPISVAFLAASVYAVCITRGASISQRIEIFSAGAAEKNIMLMIWIFILAGAFAKSAGDMGAIEATVNFSLKFLPDRLIPAGLFLGACFISLSIGTSVGTIVALVPVAAGVAEATGVEPAFMAAVVVGGAFFGDNLSFISDTTIAATRTQGCAMADKFKTNLKIVLPAAILVLGYYMLCGLEEVPSEVTAVSVDYVKIIPYLIVLVCALCGVNVSLVLVLGIVSTGIIGVATDSYEGVFGWLGSMGEGIAGMGDLITITLLAGGMLELIRHNGGIDYLVDVLTRHIRGTRGAQASIAALVSLANVCTANNTIAILTVGKISADIARRFGVDPRKSASLLDTFSCLVQGLLPYGAQLLMASGLTGLSPLTIIRYLYYPMALGFFSVIAIIVKRRR